MHNTNKLYEVPDAACSYITLHTIFVPLCTENTVVPLMRDHKSHLKKQSLKRGLPYLVGNQEVTRKALVPDYPPNKANPFLRDRFLR